MPPRIFGLEPPLRGGRKRRRQRIGGEGKCQTPKQKFWLRSCMADDLLEMMANIVYAHVDQKHETSVAKAFVMCGTRHLGYIYPNVGHALSILVLYKPWTKILAPSNASLFTTATDCNDQDQNVPFHARPKEPSVPRLLISSVVNL